MGYDVSFHPFDTELLQSRILPFIRGESTIDDLLARAVETARVRFRANAWGLGLSKLVNAARESPPGFLERQSGRGLPDEVLKRFEPFLHIWGRPFFITVETPKAVSEHIDRYLSANRTSVDDVCKSMLAELHPTLPGLVEPDMEGRHPSDEDSAAGIRYKMDLFRDAYRCLAEGGEVRDAEGEMHDPAELFAQSFIHSVVEFAAHFRPGWMARGYVWPTWLLGNAGISPTPFESPAAFFTGLPLAYEPIAEDASSSITDNYMAGGYVRAERVAEARALIESNLDAIVAPAKKDGWESECRREVRKLVEALTDDAERKGIGFIEATEIYSGSLGIMN